MKIEDLQAELQQLKDEKYHLLKLINHDIRSPFNRIFALLQLFEMEAGDLDAQQTEYMDSMYFSILSGLEMIRNLRDMREIDAGNIEIEKAEFDFLQLVQNSIRAFSKQTELKHITVQTEFEGEDFSVSSDEFYVQRIVENVLSNAVKFSKRGKEILIKVKRREKEIEASIRDNGEGIKHEEEHLLFQKFKKLSSRATGGEGCLGLGLYNSVYFLNRLNGTIRLDRTQEQGSEFVINIPTA